MKGWVSSIAFAIFVGITTIQCRYEGAVRVALALTAGTALAIWANLSAREQRESRKK